MSRWVVDLQSPGESEEDAPALLGGKGAVLRRLALEGFPVPRAVCLSTEAYRSTLAQALDCVEQTPSTVEQLRRALEGAALPDGLEQALAEAYATLSEGSGAPPRLAVRSSGTGEDSAEASHAGQAASFLNVTGYLELLQAVRKCWASLWSAEHLAYRHRAQRPQNGLVIGQAPAMAVVVQTLVPAEVAGVLFTANPVTGDASQMLVSAAWGLGETVVSGGPADTFTLDRAGRVVERALAPKLRLVEPDPEGGTRSRGLERARRDGPCVDEALLLRLAALGRAVERSLGAPQDIEWALAGGRLYLLQARPITASGGHSGDGSGRPTVWSNVNVGEALPGVATPMTWSIIQDFSRRGFEHAFGSLGLDLPPDAPLIGNLRGRIYLNLSEFMSIASGIPFLSPGILARVAGGLDPAIMEGAYRKASPARFLRRLPRSGLRVLRSQLLGPLQARAHERDFAAARERFLATDLSRLHWSELARVFDELGGLFNRTGEILLAVSSNALASYLLLQGLLWAAGGELRPLQSELFTGLDGLSSAGPGLRLAELAHLAQDLGLRDELQRGGGAELLRRLEALPEAAPFLESFAAFCREYGHRAVREAELSTPRWSEDPAFPLEVIATHLTVGLHEPPAQRLQRQARARAAATARVRAELPLALRPAFEVLLPLAQDGARLRERVRSMTTETIGLYRRLFLELGRRLAQQGYLPQPEDVFFLTLGEVAAALEQGPRCLADRIIERRARYAADCAAEDPPSSLRQGGGGEVRGASCASAGDEGQLLLAGQGCSAGQVRGRVRILHSPRDGARLRAGEILVAHTADVGWTPLFLVSAGLVLELSGPLSHPAVVAREYGLPAVVGAQGATQVLRDGDLVLLDGRAGTVRLLERDQPSSLSPRRVTRVRSAT